MQTNSSPPSGEQECRDKPSKRIKKDTWSSSANKFNAFNLVDGRIRSILAQRLATPLACALFDTDPSLLKYLGKERVNFGGPEQQENELNHVFKNSVGNWDELELQAKSEPALTKLLTENINAQQNFFEARTQEEVVDTNGRIGKIDIIFRSNPIRGEDTPLAVIEFGLKEEDGWWKKVDKCVRCVDVALGNPQNPSNFRFERPLLLAVVTFDEGSNEQTDCCEFRIGVFLCSSPNAGNDGYQMSLLWHAESNTLQDASNMFGRLLRVTADFRSWRGNSEDEQPGDGYEYFSS